MKKIKSPVAAILLAIVVSFISANAQSIDCYETNLPSGVIVLIGLLETESSPYYYQGYTCPITIKYKFRECTYTEGGCTKTIVQLKPISFSWDWDTTICQGLLSYLFPGYYADDFSYMSPWNFEVMKTNLMDQLSYDFSKIFTRGLPLQENQIMIAAERLLIVPFPIVKITKYSIRRLPARHCATARLQEITKQE